MKFVRAPKPSRIIRRTLAVFALGAIIATSFALLPTSDASASAVPPSAATIVPTAPDLARICARLKLTVARTTLCSHGPDPVDAFGGAARLKQTSAAVEQRLFAAPASELTALCSAGGVSGKRIEVIYGVPRDRTNRYSTMLAPLRDMMRQVNNNLEAADAATSQNYRFLCTNGVDVTVRNVTLLPVGADGTYTFDDYVISMQNQIEFALGPVDYIENDRLYIAYIDQIQDVYPFGGQGELSIDDQPSAAANANNDSRPRYSMSAYLDMPVIAHEVGHNIGAVQDSAPHSSRGGHCYDEADLMCYDDGGLYFALGGTLTFTCAGLDSAIDCNDEDYYYPGTPPASNYLATHWNTANSGFLTPVVSSAVPPIVTAKSPLTLATRVAQTANVTATFSTAVQGISTTTMRLKNPTGTVLAAAVSYNATTRVATLNPTATLSADTKYSLSLTGGVSAIRDTVGNPLRSTGWSFTTGPAPTITTRTPTSGATVASRTASVSATFSEVMAGVAASTFTLKNTATGAAIAGVVSRSGTTNKWILNPNATLAAKTTFTATVAGGTAAVRDLAGNPVSTTSWKFTTGS
ncbi:Ig-like domain-containing protein [Cryobacterium sp. PH31-O1]|uniref:Ig-like domain-containing protein n=1 Tax=Cryobacterium sp. PH31-O1 TaxID=3046306 RepID=UPI0024BAAF1D|nr:Ig-like domain-containing protein [Cryobacterium sp. PH31-O1]MDJ0339375.1 Ig-like domain-containing protein [Cryobacterium sp. PH31-O1]